MHASALLVAFLLALLAVVAHSQPLFEARFPEEKRFRGEPIRFGKRAPREPIRFGKRGGEEAVGFEYY